VFVYWKPTLSTTRSRQGKPMVTRVRAVLRRCIKLDGKPHQIYLGNLAAYRPSTRTTLPTRCLFWANARQRLDRIKLTRKRRREVEAALAVRVRRPTRRQIERCAL
jgi:hypothetical protein